MVPEVELLTKFARKGWSINEWIKNWQNRPINDGFREWQEETLQHFAIILGRLKEAEKRTDEEVVDALVERLSFRSYQRLVFTGLLKAAIAPSIGKMRMLSTFAAHVHYAQGSAGMIAQTGHCVAQLSPTAALVLRSLCLLFGSYNGVQEFKMETGAAATAINKQAKLVSSAYPEDHTFEAVAQELFVLHLIKGKEKEPTEVQWMLFRDRLADDNWPAALHKYAPTQLGYDVSIALWPLQDEDFVADDLPGDQSGHGNGS